jgi:hypothetical protein
MCGGGSSLIVPTSTSLWSSVVTVGRLVIKTETARLVNVLLIRSYVPSDRSSGWTDGSQVTLCLPINRIDRKEGTCLRRGHAADLELLPSQANITSSTLGTRGHKNAAQQSPVGVVAIRTPPRCSDPLGSSMRESLTAVQPRDRSSGHRAIEKYDR